MFCHVLQFISKKDWHNENFSSIDWSNVDWGNVDWGYIDWGNVDWGNVDWGNVDWVNVDWGNIDWGNVDWGIIVWDCAVWSNIKDITKTKDKNDYKIKLQINKILYFNGQIPVKRFTKLAHATSFMCHRPSQIGDFSGRQEERKKQRLAANFYT